MSLRAEIITRLVVTIKKKKIYGFNIFAYVSLHPLLTQNPVVSRPKIVVEVVVLLTQLYRGTHKVFCTVTLLLW